MSFFRNFLSVILVMNFEISRSFCLMSLNSQFFRGRPVFSNVLPGFRFFLFCPKEIHAAVVYVPFGHVIVLNSCSNLSGLIVSGSVLNSPRDMFSIADGPASQIRSCLISGSFSVHLLLVGIVSPDFAGFMSIS